MRQNERESDIYRREKRLQAMLHDSFKRTLVDLLQTRASAMGDKLAFRFIAGPGEEETFSLTYRDLHERAATIAGHLQSLAAQGERALLLFPPGLDFMAAFFGCLYAGIVAVPVSSPARNRGTSSVDAIFHASKSSLILSTTGHRKLIKQCYAHLSGLLEQPWLATDQMTEDRQRPWRELPLDGRQTAFLQYTSGSTSAPKGVVLSHENLMYNAALIERAFGNTPESSAVFWLPLYHDMGLIGGVVQPIYCGGSCTLLAPAAFLQRPALWLETISRARATVSGGPDFAYDLCVRKVSAKDRERLDLSNWQVAFTGAERIRAETIDRFTEAFAPCGFRREAFFPCYGLAETTLMVSGGPRQTAPTVVRVRADALARHQVQDASTNGNTSRTLVGCGECLPGQKILIVDPQTCHPCGDGSVGEIWVQGGSVASGYYDWPEATQAAFGGRLATTGEGPFLRTGDLGFLRDGQLFVTGRKKDVIIIRGRNYYPEDIERSVERSHGAFRAGYCAVFSVDVEDRERLVVVQEIEPRQRHLDAEAPLRAIRSAVASDHELEVHAIVLAKAAAIPKTSSGKTRRSACRDCYLSGQLPMIAHWKANGEVAAEERGGVAVASRALSATRAEIETWLIERIAMRLRLPATQVHVTTPFMEFGMGSVDAVEIAAELECWLGRKISPTAIYNYPNIEGLALWLSSPLPEVKAPAVSRHVLLPAASADPQRLLDDVRQMSEEEMQAFISEEMAKQ
jgi:acyl-CoA synthetase (AMP-forming)/AMP-acid ligase II/acyl carrier protein